MKTSHARRIYFPQYYNVGHNTIILSEYSTLSHTYTFFKNNSELGLIGSKLLQLATIAVHVRMNFKEKFIFQEWKKRRRVGEKTR